MPSVPRRSRIAFLILLFLFPTGCAALGEDQRLEDTRVQRSRFGETVVISSDDPPLPQGWRMPASTETGHGWRNEDPNRSLVAKGDFNGDGITDVARMLVRDTGPGLALFAFVSQKDHTFKAHLLDEKEDPNYIRVLGIATVPPGVYKTACGKGYFDCREGEPPEIVLRNPSIRYFKVGSASAFFYWDPAINSFKMIGIGD